MLDCTHLLEIFLSPTQTTVQLYSPQIFGKKIRIESQMLDCTHILEVVPSPHSGPDRATDNSPTTVQLNIPPKCLAQKYG